MSEKVYILIKVHFLKVDKYTFFSVAQRKRENRECGGGTNQRLYRTDWTRTVIGLRGKRTKSKGACKVTLRVLSNKHIDNTPLNLSQN